MSCVFSFVYVRHFGKRLQFLSFKEELTFFFNLDLKWEKIFNGFSFYDIFLNKQDQIWWNWWSLNGMGLKKENNVRSVSTQLFGEVGSPGAGHWHQKSSIIWRKQKSGKKIWWILKGMKIIFHLSLILLYTVLSERNGKDFSQKKWIFSEFFMSFSKTF